jgi:hypothetical protein
MLPATSSAASCLRDSIDLARRVRHVTRRKWAFAKIGFVFFVKHKQTHILLALNAPKALTASNPQK